MTVVTAIVQALFSIFYAVAGFQCFSWISTLILYIFFCFLKCCYYFYHWEKAKRPNETFAENSLHCHLLTLHSAHFNHFVYKVISFSIFFCCCSSFRLFECFWTIPIIFDTNLVLVFLFLCFFSYTIQIIGVERRKLEWVQR